jgi:hypothetical protein
MSGARAQPSTARTAAIGAGIGTRSRQAYSRPEGEIGREKPLTGEQRDCMTILRHIVEAEVRLGQAAEGETWEYSKARGALRAAIDEARQFLNKHGEKASAVPILRDIDSPL